MKILGRKRATPKLNTANPFYKRRTAGLSSGEDQAYSAGRRRG